MNLVNLTPDTVTIQDESGNNHPFPSKGVVRVSTMWGALIDHHAPFPVYSADTVHEIFGLPEPVDGTTYIVTNKVAAALQGKGRKDVVYPGTGSQDGPIYDATGKIVAVTCLIQAPQ